MFRNFIKVGLRNLWKNKTFSFINIFGLAVSMSICLLIILMLADQREYDQFHQHKERTYRILSDAGKKATKYASSPKPLARSLYEEYPIVESSTCLQTGLGGDATFRQKKMEMRGYFADEYFFDIFSFDLVRGNQKEALNAPGSIVLTRAFADKLFGSSDPLGQTITFEDRGLPHLDISGVDNPPVDWGEFTVTGVIETADLKSHLKFDALLSNSTQPTLIAEEKLEDINDKWKNYYNSYSYVRVQEGKEKKDLIAALEDLVLNKYQQFDDFEEVSGFVPQRLTEITPGIFVNNLVSFRLPIEAYYFLAFLALVVMISACLNYTNLSVARAVTRSKEIGIRKVTGAFKRNLIVQFLGESILTSLFALVLAILFLVIIKPAFMSLWVNKYLNFNLTENVTVYLAFLAFAILVGLIAGVIPAFHLSKFRPIVVLKGGGSTKGGKIGLQKVLTVSQFVVSLFFIVSTILIFRQTKHYINLEYGFSTENIINIELQGNDFDLVANEIMQIPEVERVSACQHLPASGISSGITIKLEGSEEEPLSMGSFYIHPNFIDNLNLEIVAGSNFESYNRSSLETSIILNQAAVTALGFDAAAEAVGQQVELFGQETGVTIVGVVKDFRHRLPMFDEEIGPMAFRNAEGNFSYINIGVRSDDFAGLIEEIEERWAKIDAVHSLEYAFFDEQMATTFQILSDVIAIIGFFAFMSITIACLGLLGISTYTVERRLKEIGIRKVMGAGSFNIVFQLSKGFVRLLMISIVIAAPLAYVVNNLWLQNFANRINFGFGTILLGTVVMLLLGGFTIGSQTWRASKTNPSEILRNE